MKKAISLILVIITVLCFAVFALGSGESSNNTTVNDDTVDLSQGNGASAAETIKVNVGETLNTDMLKISYTSCEQFTDYNQFLAPKDGNVIYRLEFAVENVSSSDAMISTFDFECYADGVACDAYYGGDDDLSATLSAGRKANGAVYFEVPENAQEIEVEYETNWWTDSKAIFVVK